jgi:hypothetical protein
MNFIYVKHDWYGCDTSCCGTSFELVDGDPNEPDEVMNISSKFKFCHLDEEDAIETTKEVAKKQNWKYEEIIIGNLKCYGDD